MRHGTAREHLDPPPHLVAGDLLGHRPHVDALAGPNGYLRVEDGDAHPGSHRDVARVRGLRRGDPEELAIAGVREVDRRGPRPACLIGGGQHHVPVGVDDPAHHRSRPRSAHGGSSLKPALDPLIMGRWTTPCVTTSRPSTLGTGRCSTASTDSSSRRTLTPPWCSPTRSPPTRWDATACSSVCGSTGCRSTASRRATTAASSPATRNSRPARGPSGSGRRTPPASPTRSFAGWSAPRWTAEPIWLLAQANVARPRGPLDSPVMREFVVALDPVNRLAEHSPGFVWRLRSSESHGATTVR